MEDVITEIPPPSRFFQEDLNNFITPSPSLPSPFLVFANLKPKKPLRPSLLIVALSTPSLYIFHLLSPKTLIGSLILPEVPFSGISSEPSLTDKTCNIYSLNDGDKSILLVSVQHGVSAERSHLVARLLIGEDIVPERLLILDSIQSQNFRGKLSPDETYAFKLETLAERKGLGGGDVASSLLKGLDYFPSGSMIDGLAAAFTQSMPIEEHKGNIVCFVA
ncbi:hypothetical protein F3Y22_tig00003041pilonHSYRG00618 [Hibiscus syriacus]|uniref:Uncharacterized protein n=1 Tax=Hibiscus syriacus TaxID=106335 RepID=A0A6A3CS14_HIBSY|nr:hypothetical protein F3Y22_tig00003041pilonHSYRG00618 [Hibiscus syriacus]